MKFKELMQLLHKAKVDAESRGMSSKEIHDMDIVDTGILGELNKISFDVNLAQNKGLYYLLIKKK